jgi:hypothetical protein
LYFAYARMHDREQMYEYRCLLLELFHMLFVTLDRTTVETPSRNEIAF